MVAKIKNLDVIAIWLLMSGIFLYQMFGPFGVLTDLAEHLNTAVYMLETDTYVVGNFLMYLMVNVLSCFTGNAMWMAIALPLLIATANTAKYVLVREAFKPEVGMNYARIAAFTLLFVTIIPWFIPLRNWYMGYIIPNIWHNSTWICMMPFAIVTYILSIRQLEAFDTRRNGWITLFVVLSICVKPSFFFIYGIAYPIIILCRYGFKKELGYTMIPIVVGMLLVLYQYVTIYFYGTPTDADSSDVVDIWAPFKWETWQDKWDTWLLSFVLPTIFVVLYRKEIKRDYELWFVVLMMIVAMGIAICCYETGYRRYHGNFTWQLLSAMWFVFFYMLRVMSRHIKPGEKPAVREIVMMVLLAIHVVWGIAYLCRFMIDKTYL